MLDDGTYTAVFAYHGDGQPADLWVAATRDGTPVTHVHIPLPDVNGVVRAVSWAGGRPVWDTQDDPPDIYSAADPGTPIAGSHGYNLTGQGAWAVKSTGTAVSFWNLDTGERHDIALPPYFTGDPCQALWCTASNDGVSLVVSLNGVENSPRLNNDQPGRGFSAESTGPAFQVFAEQGGHRMAIWDLRSGRIAVVGTPVEAVYFSTDTGPDIVNLPPSGGDKVVLDLSAITD